MPTLPTTPEREMQEQIVNIGWCLEGLGVPTEKCDEIAKQIVNLLAKERASTIDEIKKQLEMTVLFHEKMENEGSIEDWSHTIRQFIKYLSQVENVLPGVEE